LIFILKYIADFNQTESSFPASWAIPVIVVGSFLIVAGGSAAMIGVYFVNKKVKTFNKSKRFHFLKNSNL
jgi:hypothetical protein